VPRTSPFRTRGSQPARTTTQCLHRAAHRVHHAGEFGQEAVAGVFDDPAPVLGDLRLNQLSEMRPELSVRPLFIRPHKARIARDIGGENCGEATNRGHLLSGVTLTKSISKLAVALAAR
jgi:hypothetical protein